MPAQPFLIADKPAWIRIKDGNDTAMQLFLRHYTARTTREVYQFIGPGEKMPLLTPDARALFGWRKFIDDCIDPRTLRKQHGVNCCVFRNEGDDLSSWLIRHAMMEAFDRWPDERRYYTYVDPAEVPPTMVRSHPVWGFCFYKADWTFAGLTKERKHILEFVVGKDGP